MRETGFWSSSSLCNYLDVLSIPSTSMGFVHPQGAIHTSDLIYSMLPMLSKVQVTIRPSNTKTPSVETWCTLAHRGNRWLFDG